MLTIETFYRRNNSSANTTLTFSDMLEYSHSVDSYTEPKKTFYIYSIKANHIEKIGLVCHVPISEYLEHRVLVHEQTIQEKVNSLINQFKKIPFQKKPVLLLYESKQIYSHIKRIKECSMKVSVRVDKIGQNHSIYEVNSLTNITFISLLFHRLSKVYIADGHHRVEAISRLGSVSEKCSFLSVLFPSDEVRVLGGDVKSVMLAASLKEKLLPKSTCFTPRILPNLVTANIYERRE